MHCLRLNSRVSFLSKLDLISLVNTKDYKLLRGAKPNQVYTLHKNNSQPAVYSAYNILHILKVIQNTAKHRTACLLLKRLLKTI